MRTRVNSILALAASGALLALHGCTSMSQQECAATDWRTVGYEDGVAGRSGESIGQLRKACAKHGVTPDLEAYQAGRKQGLLEYCTPENGYRQGVRGAALATSCPVELRGDFEEAYNQGYELYGLRERVSGATYELEAARRSLEQNEHDLVNVSAMILDPAIDTTTRAQALIEAKQLAEQQGRLKSRIRELEKERAEFQRDLDDYFASSAGNR